MNTANNKIVLGLDIGSNSIGYALLRLNEKNSQITFEELISNSIIFSEPNTAEERREARSARRLHSRKSTRNKNSRKIFVDYALATKEFIDNPTAYFQNFDFKDKDVYRIRQRAVEGEQLSKNEFLLATYSILTDRGYNNMFAIADNEEDGIINEAVTHNKQEYLAKNYLLPSIVLTTSRDKLKDEYQNIPIRNKKDDYSNSLDRDMHKEEFKKVVLSQATNKGLFESEKLSEEFVEVMLDETTTNRAFFQRPLKSFENMVEYCSYYDEFNPKGSEKRMPLSNVANVELTLRQSIDNYDATNKNGEIKNFSQDEKNKIVDFWLNSPNADKINNKNIYKNAGFKDVKIHTKDDKELLILNIQAYRAMLEVLKKYKIDFQGKDSEFYNAMLLELYYYKNYSSRVEHIEKLIKKYELSIDNSFVDDVSKLQHMDGFGSFSLKFANEVLNEMKSGKLHSEALEKLGYNDKYLDMPSYDYLPPLSPTKADIEWLQKNISYFNSNHLFYQPMMSPKVKRVIAVLRKLINELIKKYGKIDEIRIETARELNSKKEEESITKNQADYNRKNKEAEKLLKANGIHTSHKNIERAKLFKEQECECLYCDKNLTIEEAFDETCTEIEHFIPRSVIWINSQKNKILVHKKCNQDKGSQNPMDYLKSIGEWENFKGRIKLHSKSPKYRWLTDESIINSVMQKEHWQDSYLNDTRSATRSIQKYLNHYLYPQTQRYNKGGKTHIFSVTGKAISELKYMWGIHTVMPKTTEDKKDRNTNYHHTLDAFTIALCSPSAIQALHNHFKKNENRFKSKKMKENLATIMPTSTNGVNVVEHLKSLVEKYETNSMYVCPYNKRKTNMKGFKDGNLKLYVAKDPKDESKKILAEMDKIYIDTSLLFKKDGLNMKPRSDKEVLDEVKSIQSRLNPIKQQKIIKALEVYAHALLELRKESDGVNSEINALRKTKKTGVKYKELNQNIEESIKSIQERLKLVTDRQELLKCSYVTKNGKRQIVKKLNLHKVKIAKTSADSILFSRKEERSLERLSLSNFQKALADKEPFVVKENKSTLCVELYSHPKQNQVVGLKYFSSIANPHIKTKINEKYGDIFDEVEPSLVLYKNDIIKVVNTKENTISYYIFNGGGNIAGGNNKLELKTINKISLKRLYKTLNKDLTIFLAKIDFFGNKIECKLNEN